MDKVRRLHHRKDGYQPVKTEDSSGQPTLNIQEHLLHEFRDVATGLRHKVQQVKQTISVKRELGLISAISYVVGSVIGSGIFISPRGVLEHTGSSGYSLIVWTLCGILALLGGFCYAELAGTIPKSGGTYTYMNEIFGPQVAFVSLWAQLLLSPASCAILAQTGATYILQIFYGRCPPGILEERLLAALFIGKYLTNVTKICFY